MQDGESGVLILWWLVGDGAVRWLEQIDLEAGGSRRDADADAREQRASADIEDAHTWRSSILTEDIV